MIKLLCDGCVQNTRENLAAGTSWLMPLLNAGREKLIVFPACSVPASPKTFTTAPGCAEALDHMYLHKFFFTAQVAKASFFLSSPF
jgi:hypothetical protein